MDAASSAPKCPTIEASMYCITIDDNCASMAGTLSCAASMIWSRVLIGSPLRILAINASVLKRNAIAIEMQS